MQNKRIETESMRAEDIIRCEKEMIESCTDAINEGSMALYFDIVKTARTEKPK